MLQLKQKYDIKMIFKTFVLQKQAYLELSHTKIAEKYIQFVK